MFDIISEIIECFSTSERPQGRGVLRIFVYGGVRMEGKTQSHKHGFPENFAPKNIGILHISYPKYG